ncbi:hypothetical protein [Enemella sp. A6]|uniref:hypothetical protein n=1 Tax=Enemella sp. A6 TaxID=3440152 RepID=UPI003EB99726
MAGRVARWLVGAAVVAMVATGCAQAPDNFAVVNGETISIREVRSETEALNEELAKVGMEPTEVRDYGNVQILKVIGTDLAEERNLSFTGAQRDQLIKERGAEQLATAGPAAKRYTNDIAFLQLLLAEVGEQEFARAGEEADVVLNPRFGSWGPGLQPGGSPLFQQAPPQPPANTQ